jgi:hypothetical protein
VAEGDEDFSRKKVKTAHSFQAARVPLLWQQHSTVT